MKKIRFIIENFTDSEDYRNLIAAAKENGNDVFVIDKNNHFDFDPSGYKENDCVIAQGSIQMIKNIRSRLPPGCYPVAYCNDQAFLCSSYYPIFKDLLFNDRHEFCSVRDLKEYKFDYYRRFGKEALIFIRPDRGDKPFTGQLLDLQDFDRFWLNAVQCNIEDNEKIVVSTPKNINGEFRVVCSKKDIIAGSTYQYQGQKTLVPSVPRGVLEFCRKILERKFFPDPIFCIDVVEDSDGVFWLLELTSFSSAGLYACDKGKVVRAVNEIVFNDWEQETESRKWREGNQHLFKS